MHLYGNGVPVLKESELLVLDRLTLDPEGKGFVSQIARDIGISKGEVSKAVKELKRSGLVRTENSGRNVICSIDRRFPVFAQLRRTFNLLEILSQIETLKKCSKKIVLFGSCAQGTDTEKSDIDLLVVANGKSSAQKEAQRIKWKRVAQWVIKTPQEYVVLNGKEPVFAEELSRGILLWEDTGGSGAG